MAEKIIKCYKLGDPKNPVFDSQTDNPADLIGVEFDYARVEEIVNKEEAIKLLREVY